MFFLLISTYTYTLIINIAPIIRLIDSRITIRTQNCQLSGIVLSKAPKNSTMMI
jgi:hypothetical protein